MLLLDVLLLGVLAALTAYARHLESTVITLEQRSRMLPASSRRPAAGPAYAWAGARWPAALGIAMLFAA